MFEKMDLKKCVWFMLPRKKGSLINSIIKKVLQYEERRKLIVKRKATKNN